MSIAATRWRYARTSGVDSRFARAVTFRSAAAWSWRTSSWCVSCDRSCGEATAALRQLLAQPARVRAARAERAGGALYVRPDRLRFPAHRQLPDIHVRGHAEARVAVERLCRHARDE